MDENRCVCCGADIPEGRQCCPSCLFPEWEEDRKAFGDCMAESDVAAAVKAAGKEPYDD